MAGFGANTRQTTRQVGSGSVELFGRQSAWGTPITAFSGMIQRRFPFTRNDIGVNPNFIQSESILGDGTRAPQVLDNVVPGGVIAGEWLPEDIIHLLILGMNAAVPTNTELTYSGGGKTAVVTASAATASYDATPSGGKATSTVVNAALENDKTSEDAVWPATVRITFSGTNTVGDNARIIITGQGAKGRSLNERQVDTIYLTAGTSDTTFDSNLLFREVTNVKIEGVTGNGTAKADFMLQSNRAELALGDLSSGLVAYTMQMRKGSGVLAALQNVVANTTTITIGEGNVGIELDLRASNYTEGVLITDITAPATEIPGLGNDKNAGSFPLSNLSFGRGFGRAISFGSPGLAGRGETAFETVDLNKIAFVDNVVLTINNNFEDAPGGTGDPSAGQPIVGDAGRQVTLQIDKQLETGADAVPWLPMLTGGLTVPIIFRHINIGAGRMNLVEFRCSDCKLSDAARAPVEGSGTIAETVSLDVGDLDVRIWSKHGYSVDNGR